MENKNYNGWKNYETWNVALWVGNDEGLYNWSLEYLSYEDFSASLREAGFTETPDKVAYNDSALDIEELDELLVENRGEEDA
jgi:hypothetical protein